MNKSADSRVELNGLTTRWRESGSGESGTVLMLHSLGLDAAAFDSLRQVLPRTLRICAFDQRGHGSVVDHGAASFEQIVEDARAAIDLLADPASDARPLHVLGHSMGGAVAASAAAGARKAGCRIASLAIVASPPAGYPVFEARGKEALEKGMDVARESTLARWFDTVEQDHAPAATVAGAKCLSSGEAYASECLKHMTADGYASAWRALASFDGYADLVKDLPRTLLYAGRADASTPPAVMQGIADAFKQAGRAYAASLSILPDAGHMLVLTHATALASTLLPFWKMEQRL